MEWYLILSLIAIGLLLLIIEIIFIPGTSVAGFVGFVLMLTGVWLSFSYFGKSTGWIMVGGTAAASGLILFWTFRTKPWRQFALKSSIQSKVNEGATDGLQVGTKGKTVSALRPMGKAELDGKLFEVTSTGGFVESGTEIRIIKVSSNQILVEPLNS
jgi:membrane-bound ClpP family serine protease